MPAMATLASILRTDFKAVDKRDEVHSVLGWLQGESSKAPIVVDDGKPFGILNERALISRKLETHAHVSNFTLATRALPLGATLEEAAKRLSEFRAAYLPVEDAKGKLVGYVTAIDVARATMAKSRPHDLAVPVTALKEKDTIGDAVHIFAKEYVPVLPVMDGDGRVSGVLPRRTLYRVEKEVGNRGRKDAGGEKFHFIHDPVSGFMDETPIVVPAATSFLALMDTVTEHGYAIVQERNGALLGLVTPETLMRNGGG